MKKLSTNLFTISLLTIFSILSFTTTTAQEPQHYQISLINTQEQGLKIDNYNIVVSNGEITPNKDPQDFLAKLYSFQGEILTESYFSFEGSEKFDLKIPYYPSGKIIKVFNQNNNNTEILEINIQVFAQVCGDSNCQGHESYENCEQDCPSGQKDNFCDKVADNICDPDCQNIKDFDSDCTGENPATVQKELIKKLELEKEANNEAINNEKTKTKKKDNTLTNPNQKTFFMFFALSIVALILIFSMILFFLAKKKE
jgi:hypothetical protein